MGETKFTYTSKVLYPAMDIFSYYCCEFNASFNDLNLLVNRFSNYLVSIKSNYNYKTSFNDILNNNDFEEFIQEIIDSEIIDLLVISKDPYFLNEKLSEMQSFFPLVNSFYTIDMNGNYRSKHDMVQVIKVIYSTILNYAICDFSYTIEDVASMIGNDYEIESISVNPVIEFVNNIIRDSSTIIYFNIKKVLK